MFYFLISRPPSFVIYIIIAVVIIFFILICIKLCCYYGQRPRAHAVIIAEVPVTTIQMPPVTVNEYLGIEINAIGGGVWPAGAGPQQQQYLNGGFVPPTYSGFGGPYGQVQTMPYPAPNKWDEDWIWIKMKICIYEYTVGMGVGWLVYSYGG